MRDRLIELIKQADDKCVHTSCEDCGRFGTEYDCVNCLIADHLLANGVIVPQFKVGDTVYRTYGNFCGDKIYEGFVDRIIIDKNGEMRFYVYGHPLGFDLNNVGKTVFLTREEAEQAVKEVES